MSSSAEEKQQVASHAEDAPVAGVLVDPAFNAKANGHGTAHEAAERGRLATDM